MNFTHEKGHGPRPRILVAVKQAGYAPALLEHAQTLSAEGAKLWAVHVLVRSAPDTGADLLARLDAAEAWLRKALLDAGVGSGAMPVVVVGDPADEIVSAAGALDAEVLLLGAGAPAGAVDATPSTGVGQAVQARAPCAVVFYDLRSERPVKAP